MPANSVITMNSSPSFANSSQPIAVYAQTIVHTMGVTVPRFARSTFHTATIAYQDDGGDQYKWVLEFTCGGLEHLMPGHKTRTLPLP